MEGIGFEVALDIETSEELEMEVKVRKTSSSAPTLPSYAHRACRCTCSKVCCKEFTRRNLLLFLLLASIAIAIGMGIGLRFIPDPFNERELMYFRFPGELLMRMLKALVIPLIVSSLVSGLAGMDTKSSGKMGLYGIIYYMATTLLAVCLGILLVCTIQPGKNAQVETTGTAEPANAVDTFLDLLRNIFTDNYVEACFRQTKTNQIPMANLVNQTEAINATDDRCYNQTTNTTDGIYYYCEYTSEANETWYDFEVVKEDGMNILGLVTFSVAFGIVVGKLGEIGKPVYHFFFGVAEATMVVVTLVIWYSPIGIIFLIAAEIIGMEDPLSELEALALYIATVLSGLAIHGLIVLPLIYFVIVRKNPYKYLYGVAQALMTAFGTASSSATLPVTYHCVEVNNKIDPRVTRFLLPVGATINMDGTALYEAVAAIYIAQTNGIVLSAADIIAVCITATLASIGAASVPQAGMVTMVVVLSALGIPADEVTKIIAVDWLLDRFRTAVNVEGDAIGSGIVFHLCRDQLEATQTTGNKEEESELSDPSNPPSYKDGHHVKHEAMSEKDGFGNEAYSGGFTDL